MNSAAQIAREDQALAEAFGHIEELRGRIGDEELLAAMERIKDRAIILATGNDRSVLHALLLSLGAAFWRRELLERGGQQ